ncbi:hypothetical protein [Clostridium saccharoperbutylacetonicum]|uniref:hypothetical protein n=1 Tax=Clostridium saccharoperbutylacetonicum TaxID=36745 RepID=UPI000983A53E|nr:hypothetical protein [Clostridium saccharoperbutylacetonicum]AQR93141.1 hypothetical protein CLSAP_04180 [Clostridium saccharoperbutylacetonicum]NSB34553.1 hypothetical protein [Clostridium saccharoperbutylacetonicum]
MEQIFLDAFKRHLLKEEKILWSGKPNNKKLYSKEDAFSIFHGTCMIAGGVFGIVFGTGSLDQIASDPMPFIVSILLSTPFFIVGFYQLIVKAIRRKYKKEKTFYAITNKRLLIFEVGKDEKVISKYISQINKVDVNTSNKGMGTIEFGENDSDGEFSDINDVENVYKLINDLRSEIN